VEYYACDALDHDPPNPRRIAGVEMHLAVDCSSSQWVDSVVTDSGGEYMLEGCRQCENCVTPSKPRDTRSAYVTPIDASLVLKTVAGSYAPDLCPHDATVYDQTGSGDAVVCPPPSNFDAGFEPGPGYPGDPADFVIFPQRVAGDVSTNGTITALDASLILHYSIGDSIGLASNAGKWAFYCSERCYSPESPIADADFVGILSGDVSGDWNPAGVPMPDPGAAAITLRTSSELLQNQLRVQIEVAGTREGFLAARFGLAFDERHWDYRKANTVTATEEFLVADRVVDGSLFIAMAGATAVPDGEVVQLLFARKGGTGSQEPRVVLAEVNDGSQPVRINGSQSTGVDVAHQFGNELQLVAVPNPFSGKVNLTFHLDAPGQVTLRIYGVDGRLVRELLSQPLSFPALSVVWDGLDDGGQPVATGTYFARLERGTVKVVSRLVLIR
jgi:hypothetical protein